jgi:hypothetical protein
MHKAFKYLSKLPNRPPKPNLEQSLSTQFSRVHPVVQAAIKKFGAPTKIGRVACVFPPGGIQDNTINRLLLMSSSEHHLSNVPMAFFITKPAQI